MRKQAFVFIALMLMGVGSPSAGELIMTQPSTYTAMDTLEKFNRPENFLAMRNTFNVALFKKNAGYQHESDRGNYSFVRDDGLHVRQLDYGNDGYQEEFTRPDSHYTYVSAYNKHGRLKGIGVRFCNYEVGEALYIDKNGNVEKRRDLDVEGPFLQIAKLRKLFLEKTRVDIYDTEKIIDVNHARHEGFGGKTYYDIFVRKEPGSHKLDAYLLDGATGEILFKADAFRGRGIGPSAYIAYKAHLESKGRKP